MNLNEFMHEVHENAVRHGRWESDRSSSESIVLIHSEWSEAVEEARAGRPKVYRNCMEGAPIDECAPCCPESIADCLNYERRTECEHRGEKPEGILVELADGVIRILDLYGRHGGALSHPDVKTMIKATKHANPLLNKQTPLVDVVAALHSLTARAGDMMLQGIHPRIAALARALNPNEETDQANICEEIADVSILLDQLYLYFGKEYIMRLKLATLKRLKERMDAEERAEDEEEPENRIKECRSSFVEALKGLEKAFDEALGL